jgi:hypothetical protein
MYNLLHMPYTLMFCKNNVAFLYYFIYLYFNPDAALSILMDVGAWRSGAALYSPPPAWEFPHLEKKGKGGDIYYKRSLRRGGEDC